MASSVTIKVEGLQALGERMRALSEKTAKQFSGRATSKAAQIVKKAAKANLKASPSIDTGLLEKNVILKKLSKRQSSLTSEHIVTVKKTKYPGGNKNTRQVGVYKEFDVERGTVKIPAEPFLRPALSKNVQRAIDAIKNSLAKDITKAGA